MIELRLSTSDKLLSVCSYTRFIHDEGEQRTEACIYFWRYDMWGRRAWSYNQLLFSDFTLFPLFRISKFVFVSIYILLWNCLIKCLKEKAINFCTLYCLLDFGMYVQVSFSIYCLKLTYNMIYFDVDAFKENFKVFCKSAPLNQGRPKKIFIYDLFCSKLDLTMHEFR